MLRFITKVAKRAGVSAALALSLLLSGCSHDSGSVEVDVGAAAEATSYLVDVYAREPGLDVVEGVQIAQGTATLDEVEMGEWVLLVRALNNNGVTVAFHRQPFTLNDSGTRQLSADSYELGSPNEPLLPSSQELASFGPSDTSLLSGLYAASSDFAEAAEVNLSILQVSENESGQVPLSRQVPLSDASGWHCGTCLIRGSHGQAAEQTLSDGRVRYQVAVGEGETREFFVLPSFRNVICQRLLNDAQTENCVVYAELVDGDAVITDELALEIATAFDRDNPFQDGDQGIYQETRDRFGSEWREGGGRDNDPRVNLVFLSSESIGGAGLFGFFNPSDQIDREQSSSSNEGEILYLNAPRVRADLYDGLATLAHEFTHLVLYNQKVARDGAFPEGAVLENAVLDEGLAVLNEELCGFGQEGASGGNSFLLGSVESLLDDGLNRPFFRFQGSLSDYGAGYLLWKYVLEKLGQETVTRIATSPAVGRANIEEFLNEPFVDFFARFGQALAVAGQEEAPSEVSFESLALGNFRSRDGRDFSWDELSRVQSLELPNSLETSVQIEPWGQVFFLGSGGNGAPLTWSLEGVRRLHTNILEF